MKKEARIITIHQLLYVHAHIGMKTTLWNPLTRGFLFGKRHHVHFFNLTKTLPYLKRTLYYVTKTFENHHTLLTVGDQGLVIMFTHLLSEHTHQFCVTQKWVGGTLSNWTKIRPYIRFLYTMDVEAVRRRFILRTEQKIQQKVNQYTKMRHQFQGLENMTAIPNLILSFDKGAAFSDATQLMIPMISILSSDRNGLGIAYPIWGNDTNIEALFFYVTLLIESITTGYANRRINFLKLSVSPKIVPANSPTLFSQALKNYHAVTLKACLHQRL
jgi:small subunit ribosomal protein S2